jgi:hypothetical protein
VEIYHLTLIILANCTADLCHNGGTCLPIRNGTEQICDCLSGFTGAKCQYDVNECVVDNGGCAHDCVNTIGTFYCRCWTGFVLSEDGKNCNGRFFFLNSNLGRIRLDLQY